ncbi:uncharacterized protein LOC132196276 [Neocloeon triangulifer]|uniref:uncharacterized protein LOC132196276 n=1 Tax=Neocloeon triangulifer TaxID=2078957 RepID=UPI00286F8103|nr:uncharacterized protein LOC132196276 [Neocloeon triangulifer]
MEKISAVFIFALLIMNCWQIEAATNRTLAFKSSSSLSKFVAALSKPGAFAKEVKLLLGDELMQEKSNCPSGEEGLECRRQEARNGADTCLNSGGDCSECEKCNELSATEWLSCCETHFRCCGDVALACQKCDQPQLLPFCMKRFKKCFH